MMRLKSFSIFALVAVAAIISTGCSERSNFLQSGVNGPDGLAVSAENSAAGGTMLASAHIDYSITLTSWIYYAAEDYTEAVYQITSGTAPSISHITLEIPCITEADIKNVVSIVNGSPVNEAYEIGTDPTTNVTGLKLDTGYNDGELRVVRIELFGEWQFGQIAVAVKAGSPNIDGGFVLGTITGPLCNGAPPPPATPLSISGTVFFDIDGDGVQDPDEPGIPGVNVDLSDGSFMDSDANGDYLFAVVPGDYTL